MNYSFNQNADDPALTPGEIRELPGPGPRDLYPRAWRNEIFLTLSSGVWTFSVEKGGFARFAPLAGAEDALSVSESSYNGTIVYATGGDRMLLANPNGAMPREGSRFTCARWDRLQEVTYGYRRTDTGLSLAPPATTLSTER